MVSFFALNHDSPDKMMDMIFRLVNSGQIMKSQRIKSQTTISLITFHISHYITL